MRSKYRLGIDAGGTFTDFVLADRDRPCPPVQGSVDAVRSHQGDQGRPASDRRGGGRERRPRSFPNAICASTARPSALNALIQHKGAKVGLICTAGHEDSIEIRLGHKEDGYRYDPEYPAAEMLVPRYLRKGVRERVISDGSVRTPLNEDDVRDACEFFLEEGVETVADLLRLVGAQPGARACARPRSCAK